MNRNINIFKTAISNLNNKLRTSNMAGLVHTTDNNVHIFPDNIKVSTKSNTFTYYILDHSNQILKRTHNNIQSIDKLIKSYNMNNIHFSERGLGKTSITIPFLLPNHNTSNEVIEIIWSIDHYNPSRNIALDHIMPKRDTYPFNNINPYSNIMIFRKKRMVIVDNNDEDGTKTDTYEYIDIDLTPDELRDIL
jgi:hypothetical protein